MDIVPNRVARDYIREKAAISPKAFGKLPAALKGRAFTAARIEDINTLTEIQDLIAQLPQGGDWKKLREGIAQEIGLDQPAVLARAELLLRVNGMAAYAAGRYADQVDTIDDFPFWMYQTANDGRERDSHRALHNVVLPADDPFWETHYPPWEWGCRCYVIKLTRSMAEKQGIDDPKRIVAPPSGDFVFDPRGMSVDLDDLLKELPRDDRAFARSLLEATTIEQVDGTTQTLLDFNARK